MVLAQNVNLISDKQMLADVNRFLPVLHFKKKT